MTSSAALGLGCLDKTLSSERGMQIRAFQVGLTTRATWEAFNTDSQAPLPNHTLKPLGVEAEHLPSNMFQR